jgi:flotillin
VQAEAQATATRLNGQAEADAIRAKGTAEADAIRARMEAEAAGIQLRAEALGQNQEAVIAQQIAENLPEVVRAAASSFEHISSFTVLNGAQGVTSALAEVIQQAGALSDIARKALSPLARPSSNGSSPNGNGHAGPKPVAAVAPARRRPAPVDEPSEGTTHPDTEPSDKG